MTPQAFYKGLLKDMRTHLGEPKAFCAYCRQPFTIDGTEYCSDTCAEDHDTVQRGGTPLPEHERCTCIDAYRRIGAHRQDCPRAVPHPEDDSHPLENEP
jgi:predicted amidophosphoribosyltransferase